MSTTYASIQRPDGRIVAYSDSGPQDGIPVLLCHGLPGARNQIPNTAILDQHHVRLIIIDRPGFGMSTPDPACSVTYWRHDALAVLDTLGVAQCVLLPYSAGTPYALALASLAPERVIRIHIMSGVIPAAARDLQNMSAFNRWLHSFGNNMPKFWLKPLVGLLNLVIGIGAKAGKFGIWLMRGTFTAAENSYVAAPEGVSFRDMLTESFRQGFLNYFTEFAIVGAPWGVDFRRITHPVSCWYGDSDYITPASAAQRLQQLLPQTTVRIWPGAGHLLIFMHWDELIASLATKAESCTVVN